MAPWLLVAHCATTHTCPCTDKRYQATLDLGADLSTSDGTAFSPGFSIKGEDVEGRPSYLDVQATSPLDPRVLDAMLPYVAQ